MPEQLTELGRRVLGHLPPWVEDEARLLADFKEAYGHTDFAERFITAETLTKRLATDQTTHDEEGTPTLDEEKVNAALSSLKEKGLVKAKGKEFQVSKKGMEALTGSGESGDEEPGAVTIPLHPAVHNLNGG